MTALARMIERVSHEQGRPIEHVLVERAWASDPELDPHGFVVAEAWLDLINAQVDRQLCSVVGATLREPSIRAERYVALPGVTRLRQRFGDAPLEWVTLAPYLPTEHERGLPFSEQVEHGEPMSLRVEKRVFWGMYEGFDWLGRPVLRVRFPERPWRCSGFWEHARVLRPIAWRSQRPSREEQRAILVGAYPETTREVSPPLAARFEQAMQRFAVGERRMIDYVQAVHRAGYELFLHGGSVRDAVRAQLTGETKPIRDVDFVTTAPLPELTRIVAEVGAAYPGAGISTTVRSSQLGVLRVQPKELGITQGEGFDAACLRFSGIHYSFRMNTTTGDLAVPAVFAKHLEADALWKDMILNALYARRGVDGSWTLVDPTGFALEDVRTATLRLPRFSLEATVNMSMRFWKFRMRGYDSDAETKRRVRAHAERLWPRLTPPQMAEVLFPVVHTFASFDALLVALQPVMVEDGCGDLFARFIDTELMRQEIAALVTLSLRPRG